ncbi:hypothetical protein EUTSA_v10002748mg [Eutrema salsugineum]|uniref:Glycine-rich protein n=1 Tax=Eutrema salsugineum TaxID=72664 RepID=V4L3R1_EUTSA|nr:glycine-rich protein 3 [Eutrema salsugineum]ESQ36937.1 hypothetical protein EUTSA_v10002748mg [Eutrema salsugineum]
MASKALLLVSLFAVLLVISEVAGESERQSGTVKSESEETLHPDQQSYGGDGGHGRGYGGGCRSSPYNYLILIQWLLGFAVWV